jgi:hypothetical protein
MLAEISRSALSESAGLEEDVYGAARAAIVSEIARVRRAAVRSPQRENAPPLWRVAISSAASTTSGMSTKISGKEKFM